MSRRRTVLAAAAGILCAICCIVSAHAENSTGLRNPVVPASSIKNWDKTVDVCIVGYGLTGATAAIEAIDAVPDAKVLILEKMPKELAGGNSRASGQTVLTSDVKDIEKFKTYIQACNEPNPIPAEWLDV